MESALLYLGSQALKLLRGHGQEKQDSICVFGALFHAIELPVLEFLGLIRDVSARPWADTGCIG